MFLHETFRTRLIFLSWLKWVQIVVFYDQNLQKHKYLSRISMFLHETFRTGLIFPSRSKWVQIVVCYDQNLQKHKYLSGISMFLHKTFRTRLVFLSWSKWVQIVVCYIKTYKNINISVGYQCFCMKPSEQACLSEPSMSKWVQIVVCYDQNLQKHKYLSRISMFLHETFRTGLVFPSQSKWV